MGGKAPFAVFVLLTACGSPSRPEEPVVATVTFAYHSPVSADEPPLDPMNVTGCVHHYSAMGGFFLLSGSWSPETLYRDLQGDCHENCTIAIPGIPVGIEQVVRMWDLGTCNLDASAEPISYENLSANGVVLRRIIDHPSGMHGVAFSVDANGHVTP